MIKSHDWYKRDWKTLRTQLVKLCLRHSEALLEKLKKPEAEIPILVDKYINQISIDISKRIKQDQLGLWQEALSLLAQPERLYSELERDRKALSGQKMTNGKSIQPRQALGRKLIQFFEMNRRDLVANELGSSSHKVKTWERLDRMSRDLVKNRSVTNRCTEEHFFELAGFVKTHHGNDRNLPRSIKKVKEYFFKFSDDCFESVENQDYAMDKLSLDEAKDLLQGVGMAELSRCLQQLSASEMEIIDVSFQLGMSNIVYRNVDDYLQNNGITKERFEQKHNQIMNKMRECIELGLISGQGVQVV